MSAQDNKRYGVHDVVSGLHESLRSYIEAQYHIRDEGLIKERNELLLSPGVIAQEAYLEATPVYAAGRPYSKLEIPEVAKHLLTAIAAIPESTGLYPRPYKHQADALEAFLGDDRHDLVIATGTGSGKTESFLMPLIASLAIESTERRNSAAMPGCRALLLYPMNALVNDQVARIRRILGNEKANALVSEGRNRPITFGSYTGRTPYPGPKKPGRDQTRIAPLFEDFYLPVLEREELKNRLVELGRWPSKDLEGFFNAIEIATGRATQSNGKVRTKHNWNRRLLTQPGDRELMTRHEMQRHCPDLLVTNYSMLEYMLLRPIESPMFDQTAEWLASDDRNELILVLDEAHMYRGAGGAEVAFLIRRLIARLGITRDRVRCILTSASLGDEGDTTIAEKFARDLTGSVSAACQRSFRVVSGTLEERGECRPLTLNECEAFAELVTDNLSDFSAGFESVHAEVMSLAKRFSWEPPPNESVLLRDYLFTHLSKLPTVDLLIRTITGKATSLGDLTERLKGDCTKLRAERAVDSLLALCSYARQISDGRVLLPTRLHLFYRGLPGLFACADANCTGRFTANIDATLVGKFHTKPRLACDCKSKSRVFDFYTHRDCGAAFLKGWVDESLDFVWHSQVGGQGNSPMDRLFPIEMLVEQHSHSTSLTRVAWLHFQTGKLTLMEPSVKEGYRAIRIPDKNISVTGELMFDDCPVCCRSVRRRGEPSKIMDHITKGEAPFAALVRAQMHHQPASREKCRTFPNAGRKVLIFSDGRQKAARLARDMPRDMELDLFRQVIANAHSLLQALDEEAKPTSAVLYPAVVATLAAHNLTLFDGEDANKLEQHAAEFRQNYDSDLYEALYEHWPAGEPPIRYSIALLKLLCGRYYSLSDTAIGYLEPSNRALKRLTKKINEQGIQLETNDVSILAVAWMDSLLGDYAFDVSVSENTREKAAGFYKTSWGSKGKFKSSFSSALVKTGLSTSQIEFIENTFCAGLAVEKQGYFLNPSELKLTVDLDREWTQCVDCTVLMPYSYHDSCLACGSTQTKQLDSRSDTYLRARKGFWRKPVEQVLDDGADISNLVVEEHTAQLSNRDYRNVHSTTELHELRFQDILLNEKDRPVDVLSCTTTMEVGIDIGSLVAVALRNVPPQRENYQQRAGRAGRRGSSISTVIAFSQNGPHDGFYFQNPETMVCGSARSPELKTDNPKIAARHVHAYLLQTFFLDSDVVGARTGSGSALLEKALGRTRDFLLGKGAGPNLETFEHWMESNVLSEPHRLAISMARWLPDELRIQPPSSSILQWVIVVSKDFIVRLKRHASELLEIPNLEGVGIQLDLSADDPAAGTEELPIVELEQEDLLEFLFFHQLLPTYAFPTTLCSFLVESWDNSRGRGEIKVEQQPQQSTGQALSEYAPGRLVVINKKTYRSGGVFASASAADGNRASKLFEESNKKELVICEACSFVRDPDSTGMPFAHCPVCNGNLQSRLMIKPEVFGPENARPLAQDDREQEYTFATMAQYPQPAGGETFNFGDAGPYLRYVHATDKRLFTLNKGKNIDGEGRGFSVCQKCGCAEVFNPDAPKSGRHKRPYLVKKGLSVDCDGEFAQSFLGFDFRTDLLLLRIDIVPPLITDVDSLETMRTLEAAAHTVAEAFRLAASRHRQLDIDPLEFGAGYRILPVTPTGSVPLEIYLYDTLAGGAGYAELASKYFEEIVEATIELLENCNCDTSCTDCLDHFHNQHLKEHLDRKLGVSLLRYASTGLVPQSVSADKQIEVLLPLARLLELDGMTCEFGGESGPKHNVPLLVRAGNKVIGINVYPSLLAQSDYCSNGEKFVVYQFTQRRLRQELPTIHHEVRLRLQR